MEDKDLQEINELGIEGRKHLRYPPILDRDPSMAAKFLTLEDCQNSLTLLQDTFLDLGKSTQKNKLLEWSILSNKATFDWFISFTITLCELLDTKAFKAPDLNNLPGDSDLKLCPPMIYKKGIVSPEYFKINTVDPISHHRVKYIGEAYEATDFRDGFPIWYSLSNTTIYERYSAKTNTRVRIDHCDGELQYFLAGASDNWKNIVGVPLEMDDVIINILFRD